MKERSSEACQGRARFKRHRDASCHQVFSFVQDKAPMEIHAFRTETLACFLPGWGLRTYQHSCIYIYRFKYEAQTALFKAPVRTAL